MQEKKSLSMTEDVPIYHAKMNGLLSFYPLKQGAQSD